MRGLSLCKPWRSMVCLTENIISGFPILKTTPDSQIENMAGWLTRAQTETKDKSI